MRKALYGGLFLLLMEFAAVAGGPTTDCYLIVNGPGAGTFLKEINGQVIDLVNGHLGVIVPADTEPPLDCDCLHYHGLLFDQDDPDPNGCGWGCVVRVPCATSDALNALRSDISDLSNSNATLAAKLDSILNVVEDAATNDCASLVFRGAQAMADELVGARRTNQVDNAQLTELFGSLAAYAVLQMLDIDFPPLPLPPPEKPCKVDILVRLGSGSNSTLGDPGKKLTFPTGTLVMFEAQGCPGNGPYSWKYQFKGLDQGDVPSGAGVSSRENRFAVLSERPTSVKVTVMFMCPDGKVVIDTVTVTFR